MEEITIKTRDGRIITMNRNPTTEQIKWLVEASNKERKEYDRKFWEEMEEKIKKEELCPHNVIRIKSTDRKDDFVFHNLECGECRKTWRKGGNEKSKKRLEKLTATFNNTMKKLVNKQNKVLNKGKER